MSSCEVCEHCSKSVRPGEAVSKRGYRYHRECRKCYVCSETNLQNAETFKGVIFCASCAKRIFRVTGCRYSEFEIGVITGRPAAHAPGVLVPTALASPPAATVLLFTGCATARTAKKAPRRRRTRHRRYRSSPPRAIEHSVIERARAANSSSSSNQEESKPDIATPARDPPVSQDCYCISDVVTQARRLINFIYDQSHNHMKSEPEVIHASEARQQMPEDLESSLSEAKPGPPSRPELANSTSKCRNTSDQSSTAAIGTPRKHRSARACVKQEAGPSVDLRIAELGASTEIATMALRKNSRKRVKSESRLTQKTDGPETYSMFSNLDSAVSHTSNEEYLDSECEDYRGSKSFDGSVFDHTVASIIKLPYKYFKKKILDRSSLISVIVGIGNEKDSFYKKLKTLFHEDDVCEHHRNGYKKLYSTINKKMPSYKLGWLEPDGAGERKSSPCKHYDECHSYRCMREQVMRLAGPTKSRMELFRDNVKKLVVPPFIRNLSLQYRTPAMVKSEACGKSASTFVTKSPRLKLSQNPSGQCS